MTMHLTKEVEKEFIDELNRSRRLQGEERTMKSLNSYFEGECCGFRVYKKRPYDICGTKLSC